MKDDVFKVLWISKATGVMRSFVFNVFEDDKQNKRIIYVNEDNDKVLTIYTDDLSYMITAPYIGD